MRYFKIIKDGNIFGIGIGKGGIEIDETEFDAINEAVNSRPTPPSGYGLVLLEDLTWHEYQIPPSTEGQAVTTESDYLAALERFGVYD